MQMDAQHLALAGAAALLAGVSKTGVPGLSTFVVVLMALAFPNHTKLSVGVLLPLFISGDILAVRAYHRHAQWRRLIGLLPAVVAGMLMARWYLAWVREDLFRPLLGLLVLLMVALEVVRQRMGWDRLPKHWAFVGGTGLAAGFATTVGNVAGPIMGVYFLSQGFVKKQFMGTAAWFFFVVNCSKVPVYWGLGMIDGRTLKFDLFLVPLVAVGALVGIRLLPHIPQRLFNSLVLMLSCLAALRLLW
jgi:uncharacterized membrane protein YfcA